MAATSARKRPTIKTTKNNTGVETFLKGVANEARRRDAFAVLKIMKAVTGQKPRMWGTNIVGFDEYHYKYASGREGDMCLIGFAPRSNGVTLYLMMNYTPFAPLLKTLGKHKVSGSCLHIRNMADVDHTVLEELVRRAYRQRQAEKG